MKKLYFLVVCSFVFITGIGRGTVFAREIFIAGPAELNASLETAKPGDIVTLKNGDWSNVNISVNKGGEPGKPVEIKAESPGGAIFDGSSSLEINAPFVTVDGLFFHNGAIEKGSVIQFNSHHGIVRNTAIIDYNPAAFETKYYWVYFNGDSNLVDRCYFKGKNHMQPLIGNNQDGSRHNTVIHSYFKDIPYDKANGREIFRIWGYGRSTTAKNIEELGEDGAFFTIESNLFDHADGEGMEIISLKSSRNLVLRNTIVATRGGITLRSGNFNTIKENIILGQGAEGAYGMRITGQRHLIQSNFISMCDYGIRILCGEFFNEYLTEKYQPVEGINPLGRVPRYSQVKNITLVDNVLVGNKNSDLEIGGQYKAGWPESQRVLLPENCLIENNRFVRPKGGVSVIGTIPEANAPLDRFSFQPNRYIGNLLIGGDNDFAPSVDGFKHQEIPGGWSEDQEGPTFKPLTPVDVGPDWVRVKGF